MRFQFPIYRQIVPPPFFVHSLDRHYRPKRKWALRSPIRFIGKLK